MLYCDLTHMRRGLKHERLPKLGLANPDRLDLQNEAVNEGQA